MRSIRLLILALVGLANVGCAAIGTSQHQPPDSGVQGITMVGPTCAGQPDAATCPDQPLAKANLSVTRQGSATVLATGQSDANGHFRIPLDPGPYTLHSTNPAGTGLPPLASPRPFVVRPHTFTELTIVFDSGIR